MVNGGVERRGTIAHSTILHPLLELLVLELGRVEGGGIVHKSGWVEHGCVCVKMVEASAIVVLDGGFVHPGAHFCGKEARQPI